MSYQLAFEAFEIPLSKLEMRTARSSGSGGQHVNKTESKVELRFHLRSALWIPEAVRWRMEKSYPTRITREGDFCITSERFRSQKQNYDDAVEKLHELIGQSWNAPKKRIKTKATRSSKEKRLQSKERVGQKKKLRRVFD